MNKYLLAFMMGISVLTVNAQFNNVKEIGLEGKIKKLTSIYYAEGELYNGVWRPKDSLHYSYKMVRYFNVHGNTDSVETFIPMQNGQDYLSTKTVYLYDKNEKMGGIYRDYVSDLALNITVEWIDHGCYKEKASDGSGENAYHCTVWVNNKFRMIKKEEQQYRDGRLQNHSITQTTLNADNADHCISVTENRLNSMEYSVDEYIEQKDAKGNPLKITMKSGTSQIRSIQYYIIEYYE